MNFVMYGAGNIGRGFIGPMFAGAGYDVTFIDIDSEIIAELNRRGGYICDIACTPPRIATVRGARGVDGNDSGAVVEAISRCDLMAVSIGAAALERVSPLIAKGLLKRWSEYNKPLNIIICENLKNSAKLLSRWISDALPPPDRPKLVSGCGFVEAAIGRMAPGAAPDTVPGKAQGTAPGKAPSAARNSNDVLRLTVEEYGFLPVDKDGFIEDIPDVPGLVAHSPFAFYEDRKLYLHNMSHAVCAYLGLLRGYEYIWQAIGDPVIRLATQSAMVESASMLSTRYKTAFQTVFDHAEDLLLRYANRSLGDTCQRVCRDPKRKLAAGDRLAGTLSLCESEGIHPVYIAVGFAAALITQAADPVGAAELLYTHSGLTASQAEPVLHFFAMLLRKTSLEDILLDAQRYKGGLRGHIV